MQSKQRAVMFRLAVAAVTVAVAGCGKAGSAAAEQPAADAALGTLKDGKPSGLFFMTRYWSYTHMLEKAAWYFAPDGQVYENLVTGFTPDELKAHKGRHGTYAVTGDTMEVAWSDGKPSKSKIEPDKRSFAWDMGIFSPAEPIRDMKSIAGTYDGGESLRHDQKWVATGKTLQLNDDGTYRLEGFALVEGETGSATASGSSTGTWEAAGYTLTFTAAGGKAIRQIAFPFPVDDTASQVHPDHLFVGGMLYKRLP